MSSAAEIGVISIFILLTVINDVMLDQLYLTYVKLHAMHLKFISCNTDEWSFQT